MSTPHRWCPVCPWKDVGFCPGLMSREACAGVLSPVAARPRTVLDDLPLPGDMVAALAKRLGVERLTRLVERWTGAPCNCAGRRAKLNAAGERLRRWYARFAARGATR